MALVAFIGLGSMGLGMAGRLLAAGHRVQVYNRSPVRAQPIVRQGAVWAASPREAAEGAEAVFAMVTDDVASREVWVGARGILNARFASAAFAIECSTLSHDWVIELAGAATERGMRYIDAPVTGLPDAAASGRLTLLVGAASDTLQAARPLLAVIAEHILHFGPIGTGTAYKLIVNLMGAVQIAGAAEGMAVAERAGLDLGLVSQAIASGQAASPQVVRNTQRMAEDRHESDIVFTPVLRLKDVEYGLRLARKFGIGSPFGRVAKEAFQRLCALGFAHENESKIIEVARRTPPDDD